VRKKREAGSGKQEAGSRKQEAGSRKQEAARAYIRSDIDVSLSYYVIPRSGATRNLLR